MMLVGFLVVLLILLFIIYLLLVLLALAEKEDDSLDERKESLMAVAFSRERRSLR